MGQELECKVRFQRSVSVEGKAQLETDYLVFRGPERFKINLGDLTQVKAESGVLKLEFAGGPAELELGAAAEKWARKIRNPPSLMDKLGVKAGLTVRLIGELDEFEPGFGKQIAERKALAIAKGK